MTKQELFDKVATHLLTQGCKASGEHNACRYRGENGTSCAIGCLIPGNLYSAKMEGIAISECLAESLGGKQAREIINAAELSLDQLTLAVTLQRLHDNFPVIKWKTKLAEIAADFHLDSKVLESF